MFSFSSADNKKAVEIQFEALKRRFEELQSELKTLPASSNDYKEKAKKLLEIKAQIRRLIG